MKAFKAIAAMSRNRVIGRGNQIPWHLPEDFKWFKKMTTGQTIVMGRKTFESIGKPLPNRKTIILSRSAFQYPDPNVRIVPDLRDVHPDQEPGEVFICGGAQIYQQALPLCSDLFLTQVHREVDGDVLFPPFESQFQLVETLQQTADFDILHFKNLTLRG